MNEQTSTLKLTFLGFREATPWKCLPPHFDVETHNTIFPRDLLKIRDERL